MREKIAEGYIPAHTACLCENGLASLIGQRIGLCRAEREHFVFASPGPKKWLHSRTRAQMEQLTYWFRMTSTKNANVLVETRRYRTFIRWAGPTVIFPQPQFTVPNPLERGGGVKPLAVLTVSREPRC
jgi:hypothetical protein